jgi:carboxypeptidase Taq
MNDYDRGLTVAKVDKLFSDLKPKLLGLIEKITDMPHADDSFLYQHFEKDKQWGLGMEILRRMNFNLMRAARISVNILLPSTLIQMM